MKTYTDLGVLTPQEFIKLFLEEKGNLSNYCYVLEESVTISNISAEANLGVIRLGKGIFKRGFHMGDLICKGLDFEEAIFHLPPFIYGNVDLCGGEFNDRGWLDHMTDQALYRFGLEIPGDVPFRPKKIVSFYLRPTHRTDDFIPAKQRKRPPREE